MTVEKRAYSGNGVVFNIQRYSLHDGPGIRTLVFLKGCPLRCGWCSNPESQKPDPELAYNAGKCIGVNECGLCLAQCPNGALREGVDGRVIVDRDACRERFACADVCPSHALNVFGKWMSVHDVLRTVEADGVFYARSGGGITLSGGEPLMQADFACDLLQQARGWRINTSMETCGMVEWESLERACRNLDSILFDIKCMSGEKHKNFTGVSNERILENFTRLCECFPDLEKYVRTPVVPGFNDTEEEIGAIVDFLMDKPNVEYELLGYHRLGQPKYCYLNRDYPLGDVVLSENKLKLLGKIVETRMAKGVPEGKGRGSLIRLETVGASRWNGVFESL